MTSEVNWALKISDVLTYSASAAIVIFFLNPRSGELRTQKLKSHLMRTQCLKVFPVKPGVGQYFAVHATLTSSPTAALNGNLGSVVTVPSLPTAALNRDLGSVATIPS